MKLLKYKTYPEVELEIEDFEGQPYLFYEECSSGIRLEAALEDELVEEAKNALEGELPDSLLALLGIEVFGEDLEALCDELRARGFQCEFKRKEDEEYCESITLKLSSPSSKLVKVVVENGKIKVYPANARKGYIAFKWDGRKATLEAAVPSAILSALEDKDDKIKALIAALVPELRDVGVEDPIEVLKALEDSGRDYKFCVERNERLVSWRLE
ncbi:hypothetical protein [Ignicoccus hospitalis]|uniref:Uncharacterized protein n=1 Tax=Ignicoccus hospitalis (strain KIN4/I / DSM 18386 / JCM 14125) TaxID=453591 RepID=A8ACA5_IGNH4|nr:hypothetical protein [Ignicoccus hospitalis]ABU82557.1 hypothetical protein Igni_1381 [Ignicoccus hospitalis KIN4/I]HIH90722.1 hypothetical protein [Desulfurococcaceae archaeon]